jgi:DNA-binding MarR family transcriptional regulator
MANIAGGANMDVSANPSPTDGSKKAVKAFLTVLDLLSTVREESPAQSWKLFLLVAMDEGKTVGEYAAKARMSASTASRQLLDLADKSRRRGEGGMGLVMTKINPANRRQHLVYLTPKGVSLLRKTLRIME